jgi:hypothetical protein
MRLSWLRRVLVILSAFALVTASLTVSMATVLEAGGPMEAGMSADEQSDAMTGCTDCGRSAVPAGACALHCMIPPADLAATALPMLLPVAVPTAGSVPGFAGRVPAPDLHPPQVAA